MATYSKRGRNSPGHERDGVEPGDHKAVYDVATHPECRRLPPGWEVVIVDGQKVYLDHFSRTAFYEEPWEVWKRLATAS
jgi:hypothetical protein